MRRALVLAALCTVTAAQADPLSLVDYAAVIAANADRAVPSGQGDSRIFLRDGVELLVSAQDRLLEARDMSGETALGCVTRLMAEIAAIARTCPGAITPGQADHMDTGIGAVQQAYSDATATQISEVNQAFEALVRQRAASPGLCALTGGYAISVYEVVNETGVAQLARAVSPARLPVEEPCRLPITALPE